MDTISRFPYVNVRGDQHSLCLAGTRQRHLAGLTRWATDDKAHPVFALIDNTGTGKSTIALHVARQWEQSGAVVSRFFVSKPTTGSGRDFVGTLAQDIANNVPEMRPLLQRVLKKDPNISASPYILVVDALDGFSESDRAEVLKTLLKYAGNRASNSSSFKVLMTLRPETNVLSELQKRSDLVHQRQF